jgi:hypothetical protein
MGTPARSAMRRPRGADGARPLYENPTQVWSVRTVAKFLGLVLIGVLVLAVGGWATLALLYFDHANAALRQVLAAGFALATLVALVGLAFARLRWRAIGVFAALFGAVFVSWLQIEPSNDRDWQAETARLAYATFDGDRVTIHNVRNFDYRSETDFTPAYDDRTFDLNGLQSVDLAAVYWMGPAVAHIFLSFGFADGQHVAISIEARREKGESYSTVQGFFRQFELYYVVADERDVIRLRTNYRKDPPEDVYLYRLRGDAGSGRRLLLEYLAKINALKERPEWYNALTTNCTSNIWVHSRVNPGHLPYSWKILASGYVPEYLYENGRLDTSVPFEELRRRSYVNPRAQAADQAADFSARIRAPSPP